MKNKNRKIFGAVSILGVFIWCGLQSDVGSLFAKNNRPTADDQSFTQRDIDISSKIRTEVNNNDNLSVAGKNIKIITQNGKVTLRGEVENALERSWIEEQATQVVGKKNVLNNLTLKN